MEPMVWSIVASVAAALAGVLAAAFLAPKRHIGHGDSWISFAIGALAGTALLEMLPRAWQDFGSTESVLSLVLLCAASCYALDRLFHCRRPAHDHGEHCYPHDGQVSQKARSRILLLGDLFHSTVDGSLIAAAFMTGVTAGLVVTAAIVVHELPRKCATVFMLMHAGRTRGRALVLGSASSFGVLGGTLVTWLSLHSISNASSPLLLGAAAIMLYVAVVELLPILRSGTRMSLTLRHARFMFLGAVCVSGTHILLEPFV